MKDAVLRPFVLAALLFASPLQADHPPEWLVAEGRPENKLANLEVGTSTIADAVKIYGPPTSNAAVEGSFETEYTWESPTSTLKVTTMHPDEAPVGWQVIYAVEIRQKGLGKLTLSTGSGVHVGATLPQVIRVYGNRYMTDWRELSAESRTVTFIFTNETELSLGFSDEGRVVAISLIQSQE